MNATLLCAHIKLQEVTFAELSWAWPESYHKYRGRAWYQHLSSANPRLQLCGWDVQDRRWISCLIPMQSPEAHLLGSLCSVVVRTLYSRGMPNLFTPLEGPSLVI